MATLVKEREQFIEQDCTITHEGHSFTSGGSWLMTNSKTGKMQGILYASPETNEVTSWDGSLRIPAYFGKVFQGNMSRRQYCWFTYAGKHFVGINYSVDWQECISVKEIK